jgi:hypothetical protein
MGEAWFKAFPDELARLLVDARTCADVCEAHLDDPTLGPDDLRRTVHALAAPAAISRLLIELIDEPAEVVLAAVRVCRDLAATAAGDPGLPAEIAAALRAASGSAARLLDAAG